MNNKNSRNFTPLQGISVGGGGGGSGSKELEPSNSPFEKIVYYEAFEHEPDQETAQYVENRPETIKINEDLKKIGVQSNHNSKFSSFKEVRLPLSDKKIVEGLKEPVDSSFRWLAEFAILILKKAHATLKNIHGRIMRVATA
ncbi:MAG: hypothetical protein ABH812_01945 [bacterium]